MILIWELQSFRPRSFGASCKSLACRACLALIAPSACLGCTIPRPRQGWAPLCNCLWLRASPHPWLRISRRVDVGRHARRLRECVIVPLPYPLAVSASGCERVVALYLESGAIRRGPVELVRAERRIVAIARRLSKQYRQRAAWPRADRRLWSVSLYV